jgi:hypothetical protein
MQLRIVARSSAGSSRLCNHSRPLRARMSRAGPRPPRFLILHVAARLTRHARRTTLHLQDDWPWAAALLAAFKRLDTLPAYG